MESSKEGKAITLRYRQWHQELHNILIEQGLQGYSYRAIARYFKGRIDNEELQGYLELLLKEDKVQKFRWKRDYHWRATVNLPKKDNAPSTN
jgi:hypothetical protein